MSTGIARERKLFYLLSFGLLIRLVLAWLPQEKLFYLVSDDAYYYFSIAKNLITRGMFSSDGLTQTNGFHPLWLFVITPFFLFFKDLPWFSIHLSLTLAAIFDTAAGFLIYKTLEKLGKEKIGFWATAFYLVNPWGLLHTMAGLETAQNNFFLALMAYLSVRATTEWLKTGWFLLGMVCGLVFLSRTDNIFFVVTLLAYLFWRDRNILSIIRIGFIAGLLILPWLVFNQFTFGTVIQTSGTAYPFHYHQQYLNEYKTYFSHFLIFFLSKMAFLIFSQHANHYGGWVLSLILAGYVSWKLIKSPQLFRPLLWMITGTILFTFFHVFFRWSFRLWYAQTIFVLTLPIVALCFEKTKKNVVVLGICLSLAFSYLWVFTWRYRLVDRSSVMLEIINKRIPLHDRVGVFNSGYVQYFTDQKVVNLDGLVNNEVLPYYKQKKGLEYLRSKEIRWLIDTPAYLKGLFGTYFGPKAESSLAVVDITKNIAYTKNVLWVVAVLPEGRRPLPGREMPIDRDYADYRRWDKIPLLPSKL
jgi:hypothetical protein